jgi:hypothetical protein
MVAEATAARDAFAAWVAARNTLPPAVEAGLAANGGDRAKLLAERRQLTDFRLALDAVTAVLAGRDKILIDSAMLPGKRHILLMDPDAARLPALVAPARPDRDPDRP